MNFLTKLNHSYNTVDQELLRNPSPPREIKRPLKKKTKIGFHDRLSLNAGQKCYTILSTFI